MKISLMRVSKNMTQSELAEKLDVSRTTVTMWENEKSFPTVNMLKKLAEVLECSVNDLI